MFKSLKSKIWGSSSGKVLSDSLDISIYQINEQNQDPSKRKVLATGSGSWLGFIEFDGKPYWQINQTYEKWQLINEVDKDAYLLPSDSTNRKDHQQLKVANYEQAEIEKHTLEELQRHDKKLRVAAKARREQEQA